METPIWEYNRIPCLNRLFVPALIFPSIALFLDLKYNIGLVLINNYFIYKYTF